MNPRNGQVRGSLFHLDPDHLVGLKSGHLLVVSRDNWNKGPKEGLLRCQLHRLIRCLFTALHLNFHFSTSLTASLVQASQDQNTSESSPDSASRFSCLRPSFCKKGCTSYL